MVSNFGKIVTSRLLSMKIFWVIVEQFNQDALEPTVIELYYLDELTRLPILPKVTYAS